MVSSKKEIEDVKPIYKPSTVNTDGWDATQNSWKAPFPYKDYMCPAEKVNGFRYHDNWLHNLLISASSGGCCYHPPNPL